MTGLALTTASVAATPAAPAAGRTRAAVADRPATDEHRGQLDGGKPSHQSREDPGKKGGTSPGVPVPCDADALIAAITLANARGGGVLDLARDCTYLLTANIDGAGLPAITSPITLNGSKGTTIERAAAADQFRVLTVNAGGNLTLNHLTITGGQTTGAGADGAGLLVDAGGALTTSHSTITRNIASDAGGGIANNGTARLRSSKVSRNTADSSGGGVLNSGLLNISKSGIHSNTALVGAGATSTGTVLIEHSSISGNSAREANGGLFVESGTATVTDSRVTKNSATEVVGGILAGLDTEVTLRSVTIADNVSLTAIVGGLGVDDGASVVVDASVIKNNNASFEGGGIYNLSELVLRNTKIFGNQAGIQGGGIYNEDIGTVTLFTTKVTKNIAGEDGGGIYNEAGGTVNLNTATGTVVVKNRPNNCVEVPGCAG
ncbi:right-handed parallel beta-helix repeat-containing protein [Salinispora sp. H7-4]|uniref:right-handed parallel beta-helix repeat-containing protein n=1 Tax=Salinispora sp. H7-4 TaxID=2748321 RepID=UPI0015D3FA20|nr:right-handed parallel beta-helix repeat-containing protein [Salinispora sp. H7-4]NYT92646.1 right-handed parallel beta-helix repeat-containing protein [Salinispora sp. H7-4]